MADTDRKPLGREDLLRFFLDGCTPADKWQVGMETENIGMVAATGRRIPYENGRASVRSLLEHYLDRRGGEPAYEGSHLVALSGRWGTITLEPAGQVEWSSRPCRDLTHLEDEFRAHHQILEAAGSALGIRWLENGIDPVTRLADVPWMPKARYKILAPYLGERGELAHRMMTQTTSIQCAFDYESPEDWVRRFRAAALLAPVSVALFANSRVLEGRDTGFQSYRQEIWTKTDPDRCGLPPVVFEEGFGLEAWLDWLLQVPTIFLAPAKGLVPAGGVPFGDLLEPGSESCRKIRMEDWLLHLSSIFTEVRSYTYIEVRCADLQPPATAMAVPAFFTPILYDSGASEQVVELCKGHDDHEAWREAMDSAARHGSDGRAGGLPIRELAGTLVRLSLAGLASGVACVGDPERAARPLLRLAEQARIDVEA